MTEPGQEKKIPEISSLNKGLSLVLLVLLMMVVYDTGSRKLTMNSHVNDKAILEHQMSQSLVLEDFFVSLEQQSTDLNHKLSFLGEVMAEDNPVLAFRDRFLLLAEKNQLHLDWLDEVWEEGADPSLNLLAVSLNGDFQGLRGMLLDLLALPWVSYIPMIQVISENGSLDVMLNVAVLNRDKAHNGEVVP